MKTFLDAQSHCQSVEANLASIHDQEEHDFIRGMIGYLKAIEVIISTIHS